jgi:DNA-binding GntR family transcriptional regulator
MDSVTPVVAPQAAASLSSLAYNALVEMLRNGALAPNDLVTERQIAAQLNISRTPLREAVRRLEGEKLLSRQRNGALMVRPLPLEEYIHILSVRRILESEAAALAAGRIAESKLLRLRKRIEEVKQLPEDAPLVEVKESDDDLHFMIAEGSGNPILQSLIEDMRKRTAMFRFGRLPSRRNIVCDEHLAIIDALLKADSAAARRASEVHIERVRNALIQNLAGH